MMRTEMKRTENSGIARIGRSYPRPTDAAAGGTQVPRAARRLRVTGGILAALAALGLIGWLLAR